MLSHSRGRGKELLKASKNILTLALLAEGCNDRLESGEDASTIHSAKSTANLRFNLGREEVPFSLVITNLRVG
ncbi:hypothetical protein CCP3SC1_30059 [Gammaproteobacteria bacterium]